MIKRIVKLITCIVTVILLIGIVCYLGLTLYYKGGFSYGTWINGIYCTGRSVSEVERELTKQYHFDGLMIRYEDTDTMILAEDIDYTYHFDQALEIYLEQQNPYLWIHNLFDEKEKQLLPVVSYNQAKLDEIIAHAPWVLDPRNQFEEDIILLPTEKGFVLQDGIHNRTDQNKIKDAITDALKCGKNEIILDKENCFYDLKISKEQQDTLALWEQIKAFRKSNITYVLGKDREVLKDAQLDQFILCDEFGYPVLDCEGKISINQDMVKQYVTLLAEKYDSVGKARNFHTTIGKTVTVSGGTYGNELDQKAEIAYLADALQNNVVEEHVPTYKKEAREHGLEDIGDTYIEVDLEQQHLYYYVAGKLVLDTEVVTGNERLNRDTPCTVSYVYAKQTNRVLRGPGYAAHVNYWMPVYKGIGIHDANWRSEYGGDIFKTNGSHGCINTPYEQCKKLYENVEIGTPVIIWR